MCRHFWDDTYGRARTPWLILLPLVGAFAATSANDLVPFELSAPVAQLLATGAPTIVAVLLVMFSRRFLGGRSLTDYGLAIDRRWWIDLTVGFTVAVLAVCIPFLVAIGAGWADVVATFDPGDLTLWPGILLLTVAMLCTGFWEDLVLRGVFLCNTADGLRRWLSPQPRDRRGLGLSALVFALGHLGQTGVSITLLTFILSGFVLGVVYLVSGNLALVIGAHAAFNITANVLFDRGGQATAGFSAIMRLEVDPTLTLLRQGGLLEAAAFLLLGLFALLWLRHSRGTVTIDLAALHLDAADSAAEPAPVPASASAPFGHEYTDVRSDRDQ